MTHSCIKCGKIKKRSEFYERDGGKGVRSACKRCMARAQAERLRVLRAAEKGAA